MTLKKKLQRDFFCSERGAHLALGEKRSGVIWAKIKPFSSNVSLKKKEGGKLKKKESSCRKGKQVQGKTKSCNVLGGLIRVKIKCHAELCFSPDVFYSKSHHPVNPL